MDNGYLFFNVTPVEVNIQNDSVDVEMRISEGKPAILNNIVINGNDLTNEKVVRRQIMTRPGYLISQTDSPSVKSPPSASSTRRPSCSTARVTTSSPTS